MARVMVGIPSYNNASTISRVAEIAAKGLLEYFGGGIILNSDGGSTDGTREAFMRSETPGVEKETFVYEGIPGKGSAMRAIMERAEELGVDAVVFLDADLRSVQPWWVERLAGPIVEGKADYVTPYYIRHKYDATITNHVCYPMTAALYGKKVRQPIGGDFGVSSRLIEIYLSKPQEVWKSDVARFGIDIWMTTTALAEGMRVVQAALGAKIHDVKDPGKHLGPMFKQVVSTLFQLMRDYEGVWMKINGVEEVPIYGDVKWVEPEEIRVDVENLKRRAMEEVRDLDFIDGKILDEVRKKGKLDVSEWIEVVHSFALAFPQADVEDMIPFYFARVAAFVEETRDMSTKEAEKVVEKQLEEFVKAKERLIERWKG